LPNSSAADVAQNLKKDLQNQEYKKQNEFVVFPAKVMRSLAIKKTGMAGSASAKLTQYLYASGCCGSATHDFTERRISRLKLMKSLSQQASDWILNFKWTLSSG